MAIGDPYIDASDLASYLGIPNPDTTMLENAIAAASDWVNDYCGRDFNQETTATSRVYEPLNAWHCNVDDFWTTTDLAVAFDSGDNGTYSLALTASDYVLKPYNGIEGGIGGFPYRQILAVANQVFLAPQTVYTIGYSKLRPSGRPHLQVTAKWGWTAVPDKVKQATRILASEVYRLKDAPLGVAGINDFGLVRVKEVPQVAMLLRTLQHPSRGADSPLVA